MRHLQHVTWTAAAVIVAASLMTTPAQAVIITGNVAASTEQTGSNYQAELTYLALNANAATLTVDIDNLTPGAVGGFLVAFVLNNPGDNIASVNLTAVPPLSVDWDELDLDNNNVSANPFGDFDFGASTTGDFEGGGSPNSGLAAGGSGTFVFALTGNNLDTLTDASFLSPLSVDASTGNGAQFFVARFRGLIDGGSDKVPAIPEPSTYGMLLAGLGLIGFALRRRKKH